MPTKAPSDRRLAVCLRRPLQTIIYMHKAKREPDADKSLEAMRMEVDDQLDNGNFLLRSKTKCQKGWTNLPKIRQMKCRENDGSRGSTTARQYVGCLLDLNKPTPCAIIQVKTKQAMCTLH